MTEETLLRKEDATVPPDEIIKLNCLQMAVDWNAVNVIEAAKEMYEWVKETGPRTTIAGEPWKEYGNNYTVDLTGSPENSKIVAAEEPKE